MPKSCVKNDHAVSFQSPDSRQPDNTNDFFLKVTGRGENPPPEFHSFNIVADHELQKKLLTRRSKYFSNTGENEGEETQHDAG